MSNVMFGRPAGVGRQEEPAMFGRRLPAGVKSLGLDAAMLVSSGCPATHSTIRGCDGSPRSSDGHPASLPHYGASSELIDRSSGRTETTTHSTSRCCTVTGTRQSSQ
ncbi:hypothetical protein E2C01_052737 [Portunus trituberculatus]|uniref:Uncharacterized protein n=1 Tax=Portunus trituberculatus TaxID=210409 RepID=A0A5B7GP21_PORTR|nr:hypothetical protein [Portunus trituberculatus]